MRRLLKENDKAVVLSVEFTIFLAIAVTTATTVGLIYRDYELEEAEKERDLCIATIDKCVEAINYIENITFEYEQYGDNHRPTITDEYPEDGATSVEFNPIVHVHAGDLDGDMLMVSFYIYDTFSGAPQRPILQVLVSANTTVFCPFPATIPNTTYYWYVTVFDWTIPVRSPIYSFTTKNL